MDVVQNNIHATNYGSRNEAVLFSALLSVYDWWKKIDKQLNSEASFTYLLHLLGKIEMRIFMKG